MFSFWKADLPQYKTEHVTHCGGQLSPRNIHCSAGNNWHHYVINKSVSYAHSPPPPFFFLQSSNISTRSGEKKKKKEKSSDGDIFPQFLFFLHILVYTTYPKITRQDINHNTIQGLWNSRTLIGSHIPFDFFLPSKISIYRIFSRNMKGWDFKMENKAENPFTRIPNSQSPFNIQIKDKTLQILCNSKTSSRKLRIQIIQGLES